jgi:carbon-monoxide dehydrogenase small subunit
MADTREISVTINGAEHTREVETRLNLADFLRHELEMTGTHVGCEHGACGACTVLVDGEAVRSCLMLAVQANGQEVTTVEGLAADDGALHPVQEAFWKNHGLQCGFCTPGMVISVTAFLKDNPDPTEKDVRAALSGNICRCTGYQGIVAAALEAAATMRGEG